MVNIAIIGAGVSGLALGHLLKGSANITLFEKARGVGGRVATRRAMPYAFDHGAQYATARTQSFQRFIQPLIDGGIMARWDARYIAFKGDQIVMERHWLEDNIPRYVGVPSMNAIAKYFAQDLNVKLNTKIVCLKRSKQWQLVDASGVVYDGFDWVISTMPAPQASVLFPNYFQHYETIESIKMQPCFALMLGFGKALSLDFDAAHVAHADIAWLATNQRRKGSAQPFTMVAHSSAAYARMHGKSDDQSIIEHLISEINRIIGCDVGVAEHKVLHRWQFASNEKQGEDLILLDSQNRLAACGDWCVGGRIEGAFVSACSLADALKEVGFANPSCLV